MMINGNARESLSMGAVGVPPREGKVSRWVSFFILTILIVYFAMIDLKGVWTDETLRLGVMNGGQQFTADGIGSSASLQDVAREISHYAHQPLYFLLQNRVMWITQSHDAVVLRGVNLVFLWASLMGVLALTGGWQRIPQLVALSVFALNAYLMMHVMQIREYTLGIACTLWTIWFTLRLMRLDVTSLRTALPWFIGYGLLLCIGFFNQSWIVLAAFPQGLVLLSRGVQRVRFYALLAVSYGIVGAAAIPYLLSHLGKINVGQWDSDNSASRLWAGLLNGYHLVLSGSATGGYHTEPGDIQTSGGVFGNVLAVFWLAVVVLGVALLLRPRFRRLIQKAEPQTVLATILALLTCFVMLVFQIGYFFSVDALPIYPRYFAIYYPFLMLLVFLGFNSLYTLAGLPDWTGPTRSLLRGGVAVVMAMTVVSAVWQTASYYRDPYYDTFMSKACNWTQLTNRIGATVATSDTLLGYDFLFASTLTYVRPFANPVISLADLREGRFAPGAEAAYLNMNLPPVMLETATASLGKIGLHPARTVVLSSPDWQTCSRMWRHVELRFFRKD